MNDSGTRPPKTYNAFVREFPKLGEAWESIRLAEEAGPFDQREMRLLKLAVAVGSGKEGPVHSSVRKAKSAGCSDAEIRHVVALAASTIGLPPAVAAYSWVIEELAKAEQVGKTAAPAPDGPGKGAREA